MTTYAQYVEQIAKLQALGEAARKDEISGAIQKIQELMQLHGITVEDLAAGSRSKPAKAKCLDSWDHVPMRSWPLFKARQVLRTLFQSDLSLVA